MICTSALPAVDQFMCVHTNTSLYHTTMYIAVRYSVCIRRCVHTPGEPTEVINEDAEQAFIEAGEQPLPGGRRVDTWSMCFQGGTFDRVKERCGSSLSVASHHVWAWIHIPSCTFHTTYGR